MSNNLCNIFLEYVKEMSVDNMGHKLKRENRKNTNQLQRELVFCSERLLSKVLAKAFVIQSTVKKLPLFMLVDGDQCYKIYLHPDSAFIF